MSDPDENIALTLTQRALSDPSLIAVLEPASRHRNPLKRRYREICFGELEKSSNQLANGLVLAGIKPGTRAVLMVKPSFDFFCLTFACFKSGIIPVFIDPGMGVKGLGKCIQESRATAFIGIPKAHFARRLFGWGRSSLSMFVTIHTGKDRLTAWTSKAKKSYQYQDLPANLPDSIQLKPEVAAVLFTSGSTGPAKGVQYTHRIFNAQIASLKDLFGIQPGEVDLCTFPLFALFAPALGMTSIIPRMDFTRPGQVDPAEIFLPVKRFQVTNLFGSPALLRRLRDSLNPPHQPLASLNRVVSAGAPVPADVINGIKQLMNEKAEVFTPYGATESLPVACIGSNQILGETAEMTARGRGVCVGYPVQGMTVKIIGVSNEPIPEWQESLTLPVGTTGEIVVSGDQVTQHYDSRPDADAVSKILDQTQSPSRYRHRMGDLGYFDDQGRLWFCGRKAHRVWTPHGALDTITTEAIFNQHPFVFRTALVGIGPRGQQKPVVCVELYQKGNRFKTRQKSWAQIEEELRNIARSHPELNQIEIFLQHPGFPVDIRHNSKIFREKLAVWAEGRASS
ncbi:MAG: hypothetical protein RJA81_1517 [Planctomycetota bacterium]|jgi:acyl-CoA synthetase (AMP-forming)/AMP-acid ligase II